MLRVLLAAGAAPGWSDAATRDSLLHAAASSGHVEVIHMLLQAGPDPNRSPDPGPSPAPSPSPSPNPTLPSTTRVLLQAGAPVDAPDVHGATPLHAAAARGQAGAMQALLRAGAAAGAAAADGTTPLHLAAAAGDEAALRVLLEAGAG